MAFWRTTEWMRYTISRVVRSVEPSVMKNPALARLLSVLITEELVGLRLLIQAIIILDRNKAGEQSAAFIPGAKDVPISARRNNIESEITRRDLSQTL